MSLHGTGNPQAVDIEVSFRFDGHPGVLPGDVLYKALAPFLTSVKDKALRKPLLQPLLFYNTLLVGHGTADVLPIDVFVRDSQLVHVRPSTAGAFCGILYSPALSMHPSSVLPGISHSIITTER